MLGLKASATTAQLKILFKRLCSQAWWQVSLTPALKSKSTKLHPSPSLLLFYTRDLFSSQAILTIMWTFTLIKHRCSWRHRFSFCPAQISQEGHELTHLREWLGNRKAFCIFKRLVLQHLVWYVVIAIHQPLWRKPVSPNKYPYLPWCRRNHRHTTREYRSPHSLSDIRWSEKGQMRAKTQQINREVLIFLLQF